MLTLKKIISGLVTYLIIVLLLCFHSLKTDTYTSTFTFLAIVLAIASCISYKSYRKHNKLKIYYKILTFSTLLYLIRILLKIPKLNYYQSLTGNTSYLLCSFSLTLAIWYLIFYFSTKRDFIYVLLNVFVFSIFIVYIAWVLFISKLGLNGWNLNDYFSMTILFNAFITSLGILVLFNIHNFTSSIRFLTLGFQICAITELTFYYFILNSRLPSHNHPYFLISCSGWTTGLLLLSCAAFYIKDNQLPHNQSNLELVNDHDNSSIHTSVIILFVVSVLLSYHILITLLFITILIFRRICLKYMDTYWINEKLNRDYLKINDTLSKTLQEVKSKNNELYFLANIDPLTSVPNRRNFVQYLDNLLLKNNFSNTFALLFIDLDRFKSINDWYGHDVGDKLLVSTCQRLKDNLNPNDFVARQGGDEFVVILNNLKDEYEAIEKSNNLVNAFREPFIIGDLSINSTISIGISIFTLNATNRSDLMKFSDIALYTSKKSGKNTSSLYNYDMKKEEIRKLELESKLYDSIINEELYIYFQPQIDIHTEELIGVEALIRWDNPDLGFVSPSEFISIAEDNGFIINIGSWILNNACKKIKYLNETYKKNIKVGVNVSPKQFITSNLNYSISNCIDKYKLNPHWIDIEITENCAIQNEKKTLEKLLSLKKLGVQISVDDFGTGYSSLIYLKRYPLDTLKIALELVTDINTNEENYNIVKAIISMCNDLHLNVIAEGVETKEQLDILKSLGCKEIQGFYFDKPMSFDELEEKYFKNHI
ncbi:putative bifunctional diguanylate cyclase/phosphodiesterase [Terrisporobacter sp.]